MTPWTFFITHRSEIWSATLDHVALVLISMFIAILVGVPLGMFIVQRPALRTAALGIASVFQTIPSLALFGFLIPIPFIGGIGPRTADRRAGSLRAASHPSQYLCRADQH